MNISVLIGTYGTEAWRDLAMSRAYPSALAEDPYEIGVDHQPAGTIASVRNGLAAEASGDLLCFLDADDELAPGYVAAMVNAYGRAESESVLLVPRVSYIYPSGEITAERVPVFPNEGRWPEINTCVIGTVLPRTLFQDAGGFRETEYEDYDLWLRCERVGALQVQVPDAVYRSFVMTGGRNQDPVSLRVRQRAHARLLNEHAAWMKSR